MEDREIIDGAKLRDWLRWNSQRRRVECPVVDEFGQVDVLSAEVESVEVSRLLASLPYLATESPEPEGR